MKTIAVERGMDELKASLEQRGYNVVYTDEISGNISACIYEEPAKLQQTSFHATLNNSFTSGSSMMNPSILLINSKGKSADDIIYMIENRLYSPLF